MDTEQIKIGGVLGRSEIGIKIVMSLSTTNFKASRAKQSETANQGW